MIKSIIAALRTQDFPRVRLGYPSAAIPSDAAQFVLAPFRRAQRKEVEEMVAYAADAVESIIAEGVEKSMTEFNRRARGLNKEEE